MQQVYDYAHVSGLRHEAATYRQRAKVAEQQLYSARIIAGLVIASANGMTLDLQDAQAVNRALAIGQQVISRLTSGG